MFLGVSLLQVPDLLNMVYSKTRNTKEEVSKAIRKNFEAGVCLVNGSLSIVESQNPSNRVGTSNASCSFTGDMHIQSLCHKVRMLEEKIDRPAGVRTVIECNSCKQNARTDMIGNEILM